MNERQIELSSVQTHINLLQQNILRMGKNSSNCKNICVAMLAALCAISELKCWNLFIPCLFTLVIFYLLDVFYLTIELSYKEKYNFTIEQAKLNKLSDADMFDMHPGNYLRDNWNKALKSWSTWVIYSGLFIIISIFSVIK